MNRCLRMIVVGVSLAAMPLDVRVEGAQAASQSAAVISAADAAPFVGVWTLELQGPNGPGTFSLEIAVEKEKVTAEIENDAVPKRPIRTMSLREKTLVLGYSFVYDGNPVDAVVTLTPAAGGKTSAEIDFAGGAYIMTGTATRNNKYVAAGSSQSTEQYVRLQARTNGT